MMDNSIAISVIVPVYNVKKYLSRCLDSIIGQTFKDIEIICVDDGSTDGSSDILDEYAERNSCIKVIHKENTGYGHSMNVGLDAAKGEYIGIVESDDVILPDFFETLYSAVKQHDLDIVKSEFYLWWESFEYKHRIRRPYLTERYNRVIGKDRQYLRCCFLMNTWSGLYRKSFLDSNGIRHHESPGASFQDNGFWMQGMLFADRVMVIDYAGYLYRQDNMGASVKDPGKVYTMVDEYEWLHETLEGRISTPEMVLVDSFHMTRGYWSIFRIADELKREYCDRLIADYKKYGYAFIRELHWQDVFAGIEADPDELCRKITEAKQKVQSFLDSAGSIIIYGAGKRGERVFRVLLDNGWAEKVSCFVESKTPTVEKIGTVPVRTLSSPEAEIDNAAVIISAADGSTWYNEMVGAINDMGVTEYLKSEELFDNFYNFT